MTEAISEGPCQADPTKHAQKSAAAEKSPASASSTVDEVSSLSSTSQITTTADETTAPLSPSPAPRADGLRQVPNLNSLTHNQEMKYIGLLLDPTKITFNKEDERIRAQSNMLPDEMFRTFHEESKTLSPFMAEGNQPKHRQAEGIKVDPKNAFQSLWYPKFRKDLTLNRIDRHLSWPTSEDPTSWISTFNSEYWAIRRANFHANDSRKIGHRISIAAIATNGLMYYTTRKGQTKAWEDVYKTYLPIAIPVWIRRHAVPSDGGTITPTQLEASRAELWVSIAELRRSDLVYVSKQTRLFAGIMEKGHDYEWLCLGAIQKTYVTRVMPFDGVVRHREEGPNVVWSKKSPAHYIYDWKIQQWRLDSRLYALAIFRDWKAVVARKKAQKAKAALKAKKKEERHKELEAGKAKDGQDETDKPADIWVDMSRSKDVIKATRKNGNKTRKGKRKLDNTEDSDNECARAPKIIREKSEILELLIATAQKEVKPSEELRHTRASSAHP